MTIANSSIAYDRYIRLEWIAEALKVRVSGSNPDELEKYLDGVKLGKEARVKLKTKLKLLCLEPRVELQDFIDRGINSISNSSTSNSVLIFAWGSIIVNNVFFGRVSETIGRLSSIQGVCSSPEVYRRMGELYGERHNIRVAAQAVIQTLVDWKVITREKNESKLTPAEKVKISDPELILWLIEALVRQAGRPLPIEMLNSTPIAFPFAFDNSLPYLVSNSKELVLQQGGANQQLVALHDQ